MWVNPVDLPLCTSLHLFMVSFEYAIKCVQALLIFWSQHCKINKWIFTFMCFLQVHSLRKHNRFCIPYKRMLFLLVAMPKQVYYVRQSSRLFHFKYSSRKKKIHQLPAAEMCQKSVSKCSLYLGSSNKCCHRCELLPFKKSTNNLYPTVSLRNHLWSYF